MENAPIPISVKDAKRDFRYVLWNKASEQVSGLSAKEVLGKTAFDINTGVGCQISHQTDMEVVEKKHRVETGEYPANPPNGKQLILRVRKIPILDSRGEPTHVLVISDDITRDRQVQKELEKAREEAQSASRAKTEFLANMSHEVRSPLGAMLGFAEMLGESGLAANEKEGLRQGILRHGEHLLQLINDILDLSKIEYGRLELDPVLYSPWTLVKESLAMVEAQAGVKGLALLARTEGEIPVEFLVDPTRFRQILVNLLSNAVKFTSKGKIEIRLGLDPWPVLDGGPVFLRLEVEDRGIGISNLHVAKLFQPFTQADASTTRKYGGTGLGLSICKKILDLMGGDIQVQSVENQGSTFSARIPVERKFLASTVGGLALPQGKSLELPLLPGEAPAALSGRILLADDSEEFRAIVTYFLRRAGVEVVPARDGHEALELAKQADFSLALIDMQMPNLDGLTTTRLLRQAGFTRPIFAITANVLLEDELQARSTGCNEYFRKPLDYDLLMTTIRAALDNPSATNGNNGPEPSQQGLRKNLQELTRDYVASLPGQLSLLNRLLDQGEREEVGKIAHRLRGTSGQYGFAQLSQKAGELEDAVLQQRPLQELAQLLSAMETGQKGLSAVWQKEDQAQG